MKRLNGSILAVVVILGAGALAPGRLMADSVNYPGACTPAFTVNPGNSGVATESCSQTQVLHTSTATNSVNAYQTTITAELGNGPFLFNETFNLPYYDAAVQAAVSQAEGDLVSAGASVYGGPNLVSSAQSSSSSVSTATSAPVDSGNQFIGNALTFGPETILQGNLGLCQGLVSDKNGGFLPVGCSGQGIPFLVNPSQYDVNTNVDEVFDVNQVTTTTTTNLTSQVYNLNGTATAAPTPEPGSIYLLGTGVLGMAGSVVRRLRRRA